VASLISRVAESIRSLVIGPINAKDPALARLFDGGPVAAGVPVNEWNALTYSAIWSAVGQISSTVASLPLKLYKRLPDGGKEPFAGHRLYELLHDNPNPEMTSFVWRQISQAHLETWGNAYAEIERDSAGRPVAIWPIPPDRVDPMRDSRDRLVYRVRGDRLGDIVIPAADMLHVPGLGFDGLKGYGVVQMARESIGLGLAAERFGGTFFGNGSTFGGFFEHPAKLSPEARQNIQESLTKHSGPTRAHRARPAACARPSPSPHHDAGSNRWW
jgi:HK97 family phage portal protein